MSIDPKEYVKQGIDQLDQQIRELQSARDALQGVWDLLNTGNVLQEPEEPEDKPVRDTRPKGITKERVRDVIVDVMAKNIVANSTYYTKLPGQRPGFFLGKQVAEELEVSPGNQTMRKALDSFVRSGMLEILTFRAGVQFRYIPPAEVAGKPPRKPEGERATNRSAAFGGAAVENTGRPNLGAHKEIKKILQAARSQGFTTTYDGAGHWTVQRNNGSKAKTTIPSTPSTQGAIGQAKNKLRQIGVRL